MKIELTVLCAWCGRTISGPPDGEELVSHGICAECAEDVRAEREVDAPDSFDGIRASVEALAQATHDLRRRIDDEDLLTGGDLPGALHAAAVLLDWVVDLCEELL